MVKRYDDRDVMSTSNLEEAYYDLKMVDDEQPDLFIVNMEKACKCLKDEALISVTDEKFLLDILG